MFISESLLCHQDFTRTNCEEAENEIEEIKPIQPICEDPNTCYSIVYF